ncbi:MAG TPA: fused MFS/spermidine synthase [bacterium]|nr:fused MFS/spermidine synthase [bacterium]
MRSLPLYVTVALAGAAVLALEILGSRILGPVYGVSLFLWSALISVTLAALSVGYALGGRVADRGASATGLGVIVGVAGVWVLLVPFLHGPVIAAAESLGLRAGVLASAALLFAPPLTLLGMVSPYAIRLKASRLEHVGRTAGNLYALSTVASVVSALLMGFVLIPSLGVERLTYAVGLTLLAAAGVAWLDRPGASAARTAAGVLVLLAVAAGFAAIPADAADPARGLLAVRQSPYAEIRVVDHAGMRHLLVDGGIHTRVDPETHRSLHPYVPAADVAKFFFDDPGSVLVLGLGGGSIAKSWAADGWGVDAVEIDREVVKIAREFFGLQEGECRVHLEDARRFLARSERRWDVIVVDVYGSSSIPFHLATAEAFRMMAERLAPSGVLAMNIITVGWHDPIVAQLAASLPPELGHVLALPTAEPPDETGNVILVASGRPLEFDEDEKLTRPFRVLDRPLEHWWVLQENHAWDNRFVPETAGVAAITDDRNPLDLRGEVINHEVREVLRTYFAADPDSGAGEGGA